jgi:hypothetical protein
LKAAEGPLNFVFEKGDVMRKSLLAGAALAGLGVAFTSHAAIIANLVYLGIPSDGQGAAGYGPLTGYSAYRLDFITNNGKITAVDFSAEGQAGKVLTGSFHQYWQLSKSAKNNAVSLLSKSFQNTTATNNTSVDSYDSHFLVDPAQITVGSALDEDNDAYTGGTTLGPSTSPFSSFNVNGAASTPNDGWGQGSTMRGAWGIQAAFQQSVYSAVYLVLPDTGGAFGPVVAQVADAGGLQNVPIVITLIPEPTSLVVLAVVPTLLARRRR